MITRKKKVDGEKLYTENFRGMNGQITTRKKQ
jgi:hypothetical protein